MYATKSVKKLMTPLIHLLLIVVGLIWIYPFIWMVMASFKTNSEYISGGLSILPKSFQLDNYVRAWETAQFSVYFYNTVIMSVSVVLIVVLLCAMTGYVLGRFEFPGRKAVLILVAATLFLPKGYTVIPIYTLVNSLGLNNTLAGVILAEAGGAHVLFILLFTAFYRGIPRELEEAAQIDGAGFLRTFFQVMLPLSKPTIATTGILQFMYTWNSFLIPLVFTLSKPELRTLGVGMYQFVGEHSVDWTGAAAAASISLVPIILIFVFFQRYFVEGIAGAVKG
ncbi:carbohydrate ABC transporter permease [Paenibacillus puerhi]|uniref:carbohydrate ABC transporter permease n=1 Tax=Paenibacillus puerhi TaxID=2692622 RepID=UPI00135BB8FF|nr:carbohydrate ABC transporter permease [Paenibacillus puerhi]